VAPPELRPKLINQPQKFIGRGCSVKRIDHVNMMCSNVTPNREFIQNILGFRLRENLQPEVGGVEEGAWLSVTPLVHDIAYTRDFTGNPSCLVYYKITPTAMIVKWENVGYYDLHFDKINTFQLIITDGTDPLLPAGDNVGYCYGDMQWTTGDASGGTNGFAGTPATVGVNQGNGTDYIQFGMFDAAGAAYDGPYGLNDGVDWLAKQGTIDPRRVCIMGASYGGYAVMMGLHATPIGGAAASTMSA